MTLRDGLNVWERQGAIVYSSGKFELFFSETSHSGVSFPARRIDEGELRGVIKSEGIVTCGGVKYRNNGTCVMVHAVNEGNLEELLAVLNERSVRAVGKFPEKVDLHALYPEKYVEVLKKVLWDEGRIQICRRLGENGRMVPQRMRMKV